MRNFLRTGKILALGSSLGLCFPFGGQISMGSEPARAPVAKVAAAQELHLDVALHESGALIGAVVEKSGDAAAEAKVSLQQNGKDVRQTVADPDGRYAFASVKPGMYTLIASSETGTTRKILRVWANGSAPPQATGVAVVALDSQSQDVVRGQLGTGGGPFGLGALGTVGLGVGLAGAIAIPLALSNNNNAPASP